MGILRICSNQKKQEGRGSEGSYLREASGALDASKESGDYNRRIY